MQGVYVAASSHEIERAEKWMKALRDVGIIVQSSWPEVIRKSGGANPMDVSREQRKQWSIVDLEEVKKSQVLWLLCPVKPTIGAYVELGCGWDAGLKLIESGIEPKTIFTGLCDHYETDEQAFEAIVKLMDLEP
jgi:hypothetical protein